MVSKITEQRRAVKLKLKKARKAASKEKVKKLRKFAQTINARIPKSELWFYDKFRESGMAIHFEKNVVFGNKYLPDLINKEYRVIIEIDGSWHDQAFQIAKDKKKDTFYRASGYEVIRIRDRDEDSFWRGVAELKYIISHFNVPTSNKIEDKGIFSNPTTPKTILRKKKVIEI